MKVQGVMIRGSTYGVSWNFFFLVRLERINIMLANIPML
jgi:hypothetical protein